MSRARSDLFSPRSVMLSFLLESPWRTRTASLVCGRFNGTSRALRSARSCWRWRIAYRRRSLTTCRYQSLLCPAPRWWAWAFKRLQPQIASVRARWDAEADGLTLFRQLRYRIPWTVRSIGKARLRMMSTLLVVVAPRALLQHTVTREVVFVAPHRGSVLASWWRARYVTWLLCRHVRQHERYYCAATRTALLTEMTETSLGFRAMQPPATGEFVFLRLAPA